MFGCIFVFQGCSLWVSAVLQHLPLPATWRDAGRTHLLLSGPAQCFSWLQVHIIEIHPEIYKVSTFFSGVVWFPRSVFLAVKTRRHRWKATFTSQLILRLEGNICTLLWVFYHVKCFVSDSCLLFSGAHVVIDGDTDLGYVEDGTACGTDRICFNHKCIQIQQFNFSTCPGSTDKMVCSGHGVNTQIHTYTRGTNIS